MAFTTAARNEIAAAARSLGLEEAALLAVAEIETGGRVFARVEGRDEPLIRFEGHYFDRRLAGARQERARREGLASPSAGAVANPSTQAARWRLLARARAIDPAAADESTSWGIGQVMGAHWEWLGYPNVAALVAEARSGAAGQTQLMARYIDKAGLAGALHRHDWHAFARGYNGPAYARNGYHLKLAAAHARHSRGPASAPPASSPLLRRGARGEAVAELQRALVAVGHALAVDGAFGPLTDAAVRSFQRRSGLIVDGIVGPRTREALLRQGSHGGWWPAVRGWLRSLLGT